jgi:hypothetical protein
MAFSKAFWTAGSWKATWTGNAACPIDFSAALNFSRAFSSVPRETPSPRALPR